MPQFSVRPAAVDEVAKIEKIENQVAAPTPWSPEQILAEIENPLSTVWVVTDDETDELLVGYLAFRDHGKYSQVLNVAVDLNFRGLGLAKKLVRSLVDEGLRKEQDKITLEVRKSNEAAIQLYQGLQFSTTQIKKGYYSDGTDALVMDLDLSGAPEHPSF